MVAHTGEIVNVQGTSDPPYGTDFTSWIDGSLLGLDLRRTDVAANGQLTALELGEWDSGSQTIGKVAVLAIQGIDQLPAFPRRCQAALLPTAGVATDASLSLGCDTHRLDRRRRPQGGGHADHPRRTRAS